MRLPSLSSKQIIRALRAAGFVQVRLVIVPQGKDIPRGTLLAILDQAGLSRDEFLGLL